MAAFAEGYYPKLPRLGSAENAPARRRDAAEWCVCIAWWGAGYTARSPIMIAAIIVQHRTDRAVMSIAAWEISALRNPMMSLACLDRARHEKGTSSPRVVCSCRSFVTIWSENCVRDGKKFHPLLSVNLEILSGLRVGPFDLPTVECEQINSAEPADEHQWVPRCQLTSNVMDFAVKLG